jgi:hypothetical protein
LKSTASLTLELADESVTRALASVLAPDNEGLPHGLRLSMASEGSKMEFEVESDSPGTTLSTILALLRDIHLFQEVWLLSQGKDARVRGA